MAEGLDGGLGRELGGVAGELDRISDLADGVARSIGRAFRGAIVDGKSLQSVLRDVSRSFADIALKAAFKPLEGLIGQALEGLLTATNPALGVKPFAKGGVIAAPSYFPLGRGLGLAGEAGPEAIVPLQRGTDGRLGIASSGSGGTVVNVTVHASDARSFLASEAEVSAMLLRAVRRGSRGN